MSIVKTGIEVDIDNQFNNPTSFEENGVVSSINATELSPETPYYVRAYVVDDLGSIYYSENTETFTTAVQPIQIDYFYIQNEYNGSNNITITKPSGATMITGTDLSYSFDKNTWNLCEYNNGVFQITIPELNDKVYFRSSTGLSRSDFSCYKFNGSQNHKIGGDLGTILDYTNSQLDTVASYGCTHMFDGDSKLTSAQDLDMSKIVNLSTYCYAKMFYRCTSLVTGPSVLSAAVLKGNCYDSMFYGCSSLTTAPTLQATITDTACCQSMFRGCTSLTTAPNLSPTSVSSSCYAYMFYGCTSLTTAPTLQATALTTSCYAYMFQGCTSLTTAPDLYCVTTWGGTNPMSNMFEGCSSLTTAYAPNVSDWGGNNYTLNWLANTASGTTGTLYKNASLSIPSNDSGKPSNWRTQTYQ